MGRSAQLWKREDLSPMTDGVLFVNPNAGSPAASVQELADAARARGIDAYVLSPGEDAASLAREVDAAALGMAGGDGSLAPVAAAAIERDVPFVCIPLGTRNHFARDLGLDRDDPVAALAAFGGKERRIDVGRAGDVVFLNNVALGVYARLVHRRERHRRRSEALARARALAMLVRQPHALRVTVDGRPVSARVIVVANNDYDLQLLSLGERPRLDEGVLHLYAASGLLPGTWEERTGEAFRIEASVRTLRAAVDGEAVTLETPLELEIRAQALRVLLPPGAPR
jgi:diacylglycerol kinase family enzyme